MNNPVVKAVVIALAVVGAVAIAGVVSMFFMHGSMMSRMMGVIVSETFAAADPARGAKAFQQCAACHSTKSGEHLTGPSLSHVWGRKAGSAKDFLRYSDALKRSGVTWDEKTLGQWLASPDRFIPGNSMTFPGIKDANTRQDVIAYLRSVSDGKAAAVAEQKGGMMMGRSQRANLKNADAEAQVVSLTHCRDTYTVRTAKGATHKVWEYNLRIKTDSSNDGPNVGKPVVTGSGMMGDRVSIVFSRPAEISSFIKEACEQ
jgi:cytochrome c